VPKSGGAYTEHAFVRALGDGALPEACFRHYLFLIHFAHAYALADYKSETLDDWSATAIVTRRWGSANG
jgi:thiaminase/transcriptional activator TenA